jgi:hypothetical protein
MSDPYPVDATSYEKAAYSPAPQASPKPKRKPPFIKGPICLQWVSRAARLRKPALAAGLALWFLRGVTRTDGPYKITRALRNKFQLSGPQMLRGLRALEAAKLVRFVKSGRGRCPVVAIIDLSPYLPRKVKHTDGLAKSSGDGRSAYIVSEKPLATPDHGGAIPGRSPGEAGNLWRSAPDDSRTVPGRSLPCRSLGDDPSGVPGDVYHAPLSGVSAACPRCQSRRMIDVLIHGGRSIRRECADCSKFVGFTKWHGNHHAMPEEERV